MKILIYTILIFIGWFSVCQAQEVELERADSLILLPEADSTLIILHSLDSTGRPDIAFRVQVLETIIAGKSNEETVSDIEIIRDQYRDADFSSLVKVSYLGYFSELMGPDPNWRAYNLDFLSDVIEIYHEGGEQDSFILMHMLHNKGNLLYHLRRHYEAIPILENAVEIARRIDTRDSSLLGIILFNLANPVYAVGQFKRNNELLEETVQYLSSLKNPNMDYYQTVQLDLFSKALAHGDLEKAESYLNKAISLYKGYTGGAWTELNMDRKDMAHKYSAMRLYAAQENFNSASKNLKEAEKKFSGYEANYFKLRLAAIYELMGGMYLEKEPSKSFTYYRNAIATYDNKEDVSFLLRFQYNLGKAYLATKQYDKVAQVMMPVLEKAEATNNHQIPYFYIVDAKRWIEQGMLTESLEVLNKLANSVNQGEHEVDLLRQEGLKEFINEDDVDKGYLLSQAARWIENYIEPSEESNLVMNSLWQLAISNLQSAFGEIQFSEVTQRQYEMMVHGLLRTDEYLGRRSLAYEDIIKLSENSASRGLWEQFKSKHEGLNLVDRSLITKEQQLRGDITSLKRKTGLADSLEVKAEIFELELALEKLDVEKRQKNSSFYKYEDFDFDFTSFQEGLGPEDQVIKYEYLDSILYVYEISNDQLLIRALDSLTIIDGKVLEFTSLLRNASSSIIEIKELGSELRDVLLPRILKDNILIVSDGVLNYLPFDLLQQDGEYLLASHVISCATSLSLLELAPQDNRIRQSIFVAPSYDRYTLNSQQLAIRGEAYNLEGALTEVERISEIIPSEKWTKDEALKQTFVSEAKNYDLIHLSMHSFINDEDPELSSLVFHDGERENELFISELYGMNLKAKLAVLSACNTGVGKEVSGEGMVSVNRAFTYAGVPAVVSSLWSAPDQATTELMTKFYKEMKSGKSKSESLRNAKLTYLDDQKIEKLKHPFFWAGFVLHGNTEKLEFEGNGLRTKIWLFMGGILTLFLLFFIFRSKND